MRIILFRMRFELGGKRWRIRCRLVNARHWWHKLTEVFPEGTVHRLWLGPLLLIAMVDEVS